MKPRSYVEVAELIKRDIEARQLDSGDRVGAERDLAEQLKVSRWVVRKALETLEASGLVLRVTNGRSGGVYLAPKKVVRDVTQLVGLPSYLHAQGVQAGTTVVGSRIRRAEELGEALDLDPNDWVYEIDRLRLADGLPLSIESCHFPASLFPGLLDHSLTGSLYELLETRYGIERGTASEAVSATSADRHDAGMLQIQPSAPVLVVHRTAQLTSGITFERSFETYRADRVSLIINTNAGSTSRLQVST